MYTLQSTQVTARPKRNTWLTCVVVVLIAIAVISALTYLGTSFQPSQVTLKAESWNNGYVHMWDSLKEIRGIETPYKDIPDGTRCTKIDNELYKIGSGSTTIYYYWLNCNGRRGYVQTDQVE